MAEDEAIFLYCDSLPAHAANIAIVSIGSPISFLHISCRNPCLSLSNQYPTLARREIPLIADDIYGDLCFGAARPKTAKDYDKHGLALLCSSFSKNPRSGIELVGLLRAASSPKSRALSYQFHGDCHRAADGDRGFLAKRRIRSLSEKASPRLADSGSADEPCHRSLFPDWNKSDEAAGWLCSLGRIAALCGFARVAPPSFTAKDQHRPRPDLFR